jgi:hypothetical protein
LAAADGSVLAIRCRPVGLDGIEIRKAAGDVLRLVIVIPRASIGFGVRFGVSPSIAGSPLAIASPEFCFPSVLAGHAALSCIAMTGLSRFAVRLRSPPAVFRFASAPRIRLRSRSLAAQSDDISRFASAAAASHASPPFF